MGECGLRNENGLGTLNTKEVAKLAKLAILVRPAESGKRMFDV